MSEIRVGNNSPSSYSGYSGGGSGSALPKVQSFYEKLKSFEPLSSFEPLEFSNPLTSSLQNELRAVLGGTLEINSFFAQLHPPFQKFLDGTANTAFGSTTFAKLHRSNQEQLMKGLLDTINRVNQETWARLQDATKVQAAAKAKGYQHV